METAPGSVAGPRRAGNIATSHNEALRIDLSNIDAKKIIVAFGQSVAKTEDA